MNGKCLGRILNWMFENDAIIESKFDVHHNVRGRRRLSYRWTLIINPLSEFRENLKIQTFTIRNVLKFIENVWDKYLNELFKLM